MAPNVISRTWTTRESDALTFYPAIAHLFLYGLDTSGIKYSNITPVYIIIGLHCFANIPALPSLIADALLIYRCYHIWTPRKSILYPPILGLLANFGIGIAALIDWNFYLLFMLITLVENLYLTTVTGPFAVPSDNGQHIQIVGIAQSLLIVRVGLGVDIGSIVEGSIAELSNLEGAAHILDVQDEQVATQPSERVSHSIFTWL
ncbi:hypothetical protein F5050DRAFT_1713086 [Lentinula boryana]|uniref:MFS general substrate transporter n=1 Tax=Lentinula boryana TaxID=40481 RepID=A0ABQ8Q9J6_9AGAR|nr:hypothetical protein F5050DRAFT_1713086 [Lentinula boryana]